MSLFTVPVHSAQVLKWIEDEKVAVNSDAVEVNCEWLKQ